MSRRILLVAIGALSAITLAPLVVAPAPRLIWNASASAPLGLYAVGDADRLAVGDLVSVAPPPHVRRLLTERGYLPAHLPMLKRVAALPGQTICRAGTLVLIDGVAQGRARIADRLGRPLPAWRGCTTLREDQLFFMNVAAPDSLDGRYFGPLPRASVRGRLLPILTDPDGDGRFSWRGRAQRQAPAPPAKDRNHESDRHL